VWQKKEIHRIYGNVYVTRRGILSFGRKNGKTTLAACLLLCHLCGTEAIPNSQLYSAAQSRDQASLLFNLATKMVRLNEDLNSVIVVRETVKQLVWPEGGTRYMALSADAATNLGLSPVFIVHDELGQVRGPRSALYEALETATGAQEEPLSIIISTQSPNDGDLLSILIDDALTDSDPRTVVSLYTADIKLDPFSTKAIKKANPAYGDFLNDEEVRSMAEDARRMPARENEYRNYILNQRVDATAPFVTPLIWDKNAAEPSELTAIWGGLDLSTTTDLTALVLVSPHRGKFDVEPIFWLPDDGLKERSRSDRVPYDLWKEQGFLKTTPGNSVEYEYVAKFIVELLAARDIRKIAFDRWNMKHLKPWLIQAGMPEGLIESVFVDFGQGFQSMGPAVRTLEALLGNGKLKHGGHPVLSMCAANAVVKIDEAGSKKLDKKKSRGRIDGMVALAMACAVAETTLHEEQVYRVPVERILESLA
jgi:phage terminase large subunit-like protein